MAGSGGIRFGLALVLLATVSGCGPSKQPSSFPPIAPTDLLTQALTASAGATSFHVDVTGETVVRPVTVLPARLMQGAIRLVGDVDVTKGVGDFTLTIASSPGRAWHLRSVRQADSPLVLLESTTRPDHWQSNPGVVFGAALGAFTDPGPSDPSTAFAQMTQTIARFGADATVTRLGDQPCAAGQCAILHWDASVSVQRDFCKVAAASPCPGSFLVDFAIDKDQRIAAISSQFSRTGAAGSGTFVFSNWGQPLSIAVPTAANIGAGDGNLH
jgi:hypothetical protein